MTDLEKLGIRVLVALAEVAYNALVTRATPDRWVSARLPSEIAFLEKFGVRP